MILVALTPRALHQRVRDGAAFIAHDHDASVGSPLGSCRRTGLLLERVTNGPQRLCMGRAAASGLHIPY
jgi:hypothetical protein